MRLLPDTEEGRTLRDAMRVPFFAFVALLCFLLCIVLLGALVPSRTASFIEAGLTLCMMITVLLFSMEVRHEARLLRYYSLLGFCWLFILIAMTMLDYLTR
jgi:cytochrome c oxidase subunit 4